MKLGIISMQRLINYGSFLQAYGLQHTLEELGHEAVFMDVKLQNGGYLNLPPRRGLSFYLRNGARKVLRPRLYNLQLRREQDFYYRYFPMLGLTAAPSCPKDCDAVIVGSDEVFSYCQFTQWGGTTQFFGEGVETDRLLSYAGSFGYTTYEDLCRIGMEHKLGTLLSRFSALSVRDENSKKTMEQLTGKTPQVHLDPVLIYDFEHLLPSRMKHRDYILVYGYDNRLQEPEYVEQIRAFAREKGKILLGAGVFHDWCDVNLNVSPFELLAYVKNADYVVSETFHGTVFSIKYQKNFAVVVRDSNYNKLHDLLARFGLEDRMLTKERCLGEILAHGVAAEPIRNRLEEEKSRSRQYLKEALA